VNAQPEKRCRRCALPPQSKFVQGMPWRSEQSQRQSARATFSPLKLRPEAVSPADDRHQLVSATALQMNTDGLWWMNKSLISDLRSFNQK
jgi:hypothetical protein